MKPLYLIDFSNFAYKFKAVHTYAKQEVNGVEVDLSVLVGFIRSLRNNMFNDIMIVLDGCPMDSLRILPGYKGQRNKNTSDTIGVSKLETIQFLSKIGEIIDKNVYVCCAPCQEADQAISSIVHLITNNEPARAHLLNITNRKLVSEDPWLKYLDADLTQSDFNWKDYDSVVIGTTDSDMKALTIFPGVCIDTSTSGKSIKSQDTAKAVSCVNPHAIPIYKAIYGDSSDNVLGYNIGKEFIKIIDETIKSIDAQNAFIQAVRLKTLEENPKWKPFTKLYEDFGQKFFKNLEVVKLKYYSNPVLLSYLNYDINDTIKRFKLRV